MKNENNQIEITGFKNIVDLMNVFSSEKICLDYLKAVRYNNQPTCPHCGNEKVYEFKGGSLYKCAKCRKQFTLKVGTIFSDSKIPLQKWFMAMYLMTAHKKGISSYQLGRDIGVTQKSAWFMTQRIRYAMKTKSLFTKPLGNIVEADETYIGGKQTGGKRGRGSENKTAVFGMVERQGEVRTMPVDRVNAVTLKGHIRANVAKTAILMTDEWKAYCGLGKEFKGHQVIEHDKKQYVNGSTHVNNIENFWSLLKRGITGIYHHTSPKHLHRYCNEFEYRYNTRQVKDGDRFKMILNQVTGRLTYKALIGQ